MNWQNSSLEMRRKFSPEDFSVIELRKMRDIDVRTGLASLYAGKRFLSDQFAHFLRHSDDEVANLAVAYIDVDNFKMINKQYGDDVGHEVLGIIGKAININIRQGEDLGIRWGGDELVIVLRGGSNAKLEASFWQEREKRLPSVYSSINNDIRLMVEDGIEVGVLPAGFKWPMADGQVDDGTYFSAGLVCASAVSSLRGLVSGSEMMMKQHKADRKAGR